MEEIAPIPAPSRARKFGAFEGVFTPTVLTILGVIMYLREGWVVGNAGLGGAWVIIGLAAAITFATGWSLSSITTNIRIGAGGAYSIISQSLGLEVGGAIGLPLFLSQALVVAMYVFGFRDGWQWIFPDHPALVVDLAAFGLVFLIAYISASFAFRIQYLIMAIIAGSLISVAVAAAQGSMTEPITWVGDFPSGVGFWGVFAVFFPAVTGIMAGANMSGELRNPRRAIPVGTLSAIGLTTVIYLGLAYWLARTATPEELVSNFTIMIDRSAWGPIVVAGLLGATFSSALSSIVGAPRILQALAAHRILPGGERLAELSPRGEPRNAMWVSGAIAFGALLLRDLNAIAPLVSMFFLLTYAMINVVMLIEQSLGLLSFRPTLRIPRMVPFFGAAGSLFAMFIINPTFGLVAAAIVVGVYSYLLRRQLHAPFGDSRSGLFGSLAEWAAKKVSVLPDSSERAWKPNLLIPVEDPGELRGTFRLIYSLTYPRGSAKLLGLTTGGEEVEIRRRLPIQVRNFHKAGVYASSSVVAADDFADGLSASMQALSSAFFKPNLLFMAIPDKPERQEAVARLLPKASAYGLGMILFGDHPKSGLGLELTVNVWIRPASEPWDQVNRHGNLDAAMLVAHVVRNNWNAQLRLVTVVEDENELAQHRTRLTELMTLSRIHGEAVVAAGSLEDQLGQLQADLNVFGMPRELDFAAFRRWMWRGRASAIFVQASGSENVLA